MTNYLLDCFIEQRGTIHTNEEEHLCERRGPEISYVVLSGGYFHVLPAL